MPPASPKPEAATPRSIFLAAIELTDDQARQAFVARACGEDAGLKHRVLQLLATHQSGHASPIDAAVPVEMESKPATQLYSGQITRERNASLGEVSQPVSMDMSTRPRIGPYKLLEKIGEGGFGDVYVAEQEHPIRRKVALKLIKPGMDSRQIIARFTAERQALAMMDHSNIAKVLDAGTTESGHPYFVMELVHGIPITEFCDRRNLSTRERLELFCEVCQAVQHSHQKGIIHRDLKPSNVLVTLNDGKPVPKVIDFGVAKALHQPLTDQSIYTAFGQMIGTPLYMSPEQVELRERDVDTRADIYSLGVLLYQLLTGTTPFDTESLRKAGVDDIRRMILDQQPHRPSAKLSTLNNDLLATIADHRQVDPKKLQYQLRGDLDWIVMKALEKDRNRRYASASMLEADVEHYLRGEPVKARPPSKLYYFQKLLLRNRVAFIAGILILSAVLVGSVLATRQALRAMRAEEAAIDERDRALRAEQDIRQLLYVADVRRAADAWHDHDVTRIHDALEMHIPIGKQPDIRGFEWHYLWAQKDRVTRELIQNASPTYRLLSFPDNSLATSGADGRFRLFDADGNCRRVLDFGQGELNGLAISPDGKTIASAGDDGSIALRNLETLELIWSVHVYQSQAFHVAFTPDGSKLVSCGNEPDARVLDSRTGTLLWVMPTEGDSLGELAVSSEGFVLLGPTRGGLWLFNNDLQTVLHHQPYAGKTHVAFSTTGKWFAQGMGDGTIRIHQADRPEEIIHQWRLSDSPRALAFSVDDRYLAVGDASGAIHLLSLPNFQTDGEVPEDSIDQSNQRFRSWQAHEGRFFALEFSRDGRQLFSGAQDGRVLAWSIRENEMRSNDLTANDIAFTPSGSLLAVTEGALQILQPNRIQATLKATASPWKSLSVARDTGRICALSQTGDAVFQITANLDSAHPIWKTPIDEKCHRCVLSPDGQTLVVEISPPESKRLDADSSRYLEAIDLKRNLRLFQLPCGDVGDCVFSPDGRLLAYIRSSMIHVVDAQTGNSIYTLSGHRTSVKGLAFDPESRYLASVSKDRTLKLWNLDVGREVWSTVAHRVSSNDVAFSQDGLTLASIGDDSMLRLWSWRVRRLVLEIPLLAGQARKVEFSRDCKQIAVLFQSGEMQVLDAIPVNRPYPAWMKVQTP